MVILQGYITLPEEDVAAVMAELPMHAALTLQEEGCLCFRVTPDPFLLNRLNVYEEFADMAAFQFHQQRVRQSRWGQLTQSASREYTVIEE